MKIFLKLNAVIIAAILSSSCSSIPRANRNAYVREFSVGVGLIVVEKVSGGLFPFFHRCPINVTCLEGGRKRPAAGFIWVNNTDPQSLRVKWYAGLTHPNHSHIVSSAVENFWKPERGFKWSTGASSEHRQESENLEVEADKDNLSSQSPDQFRLDPPGIKPDGLSSLNQRPLAAPSAPDISLPRHDRKPTDTFGVLTAKEPDAQIDYRDGPSDQAYKIHYGLAGDRVKILESSAMTDGYIWYNVLYPRTRARGWIRGDFIQLES
jgi:hypothetical protein